MTEQHTQFKIGFTEDMNRRFRRTMEDSHCYVFNYLGREGCGFFGIFDGHAGKQAAEWCGENLQEVFKKNWEERGAKDGSEVICKTFVDTNEQLVASKGVHSGCTAIIAFLECCTVSEKIKRTVYAGNVGDARAILCRDGKAIRLSHDHKGNDPQEIRRVIEAGGFMMSGRVNGVLAVTRSLGDASMKDLIISHPYTAQIDLLEDGKDEFLILACDGIWDVMTDQQAVDLVRGVQDPQEASDMLVKHALANNCMDNLSCMVVLRHFDSVVDNHVRVSYSPNNDFVAHVGESFVHVQRNNFLASQLLLGAHSSSTLSGGASATMTLTLPDTNKAPDAKWTMLANKKPLLAILHANPKTLDCSVSFLIPGPNVADRQSFSFPNSLAGHFVHFDLLVTHESEELLVVAVSDQGLVACLRFRVQHVSSSRLQIEFDQTYKDMAKSIVLPDVEVSGVWALPQSNLVFVGSGNDLRAWKYARGALNAVELHGMEEDIQVRGIVSCGEHVAVEAYDGKSTRVLVYSMEHAQLKLEFEKVGDQQVAQSGSVRVLMNLTQTKKSGLVLGVLLDNQSGSTRHLSAKVYNIQAEMTLLAESAQSGPLDRPLDVRVDAKLNTFILFATHISVMKMRQDEPVQQDDAQQQLGPSLTMATVKNWIDLDALYSALSRQDLKREIEYVRNTMGGELFFDRLLGCFGIDDTAFYPPKSKSQLEKLIDAVTSNADFDNLRKNCTIYYLLKDRSPASASQYGERTVMPDSFRKLMDGYWALDHLDFGAALQALTSPGVEADWPDKIIRAFYLFGHPVEAMKIWLITRPRLEEEDVELVLDLLATQTSLLECLGFCRENGGLHPNLMVRLLDRCFEHAPPNPSVLKQLLSLPFSPTENEIVRVYCEKSQKRVCKEFLILFLVSRWKRQDAKRVYQTMPRDGANGGVDERLEYLMRNLELGKGGDEGDLQVSVAIEKLGVQVDENSIVPHQTNTKHVTKPKNPIAPPENQRSILMSPSTTAPASSATSASVQKQAQNQFALKPRSNSTRSSAASTAAPSQVSSAIKQPILTQASIQPMAPATSSKLVKSNEASVEASPISRISAAASTSNAIVNSPFSPPRHVERKLASMRSAAAASPATRSTLNAISFADDSSVDGDVSPRDEASVASTIKSRRDLIELVDDGDTEEEEEESDYAVIGDASDEESIDTDVEMEEEPEISISNAKKSGAKPRMRSTSGEQQLMQMTSPPKKVKLYPSVLGVDEAKQATKAMSPSSSSPRRPGSRLEKSPETTAGLRSSPRLQAIKKSPEKRPRADSDMSTVERMYREHRAEINSQNRAAKELPLSKVDDHFSAAYLRDSPVSAAVEEAVQDSPKQRSSTKKAPPSSISSPPKKRETLAISAGFPLSEDEVNEIPLPASPYKSSTTSRVMRQSDSPAKPPTSTRKSPSPARKSPAKSSLVHAGTIKKSLRFKHVEKEESAVDTDGTDSAVEAPRELPKHQTRSEPRARRTLRAVSSTASEEDEYEDAVYTPSAPVTRRRAKLAGSSDTSGNTTPVPVQLSTVRKAGQKSTARKTPAKSRSQDSTPRAEMGTPQRRMLTRSMSKPAK